MGTACGHRCRGVLVEVARATVGWGHVGIQGHVPAAEPVAATVGTYLKSQVIGIERLAGAHGLILRRGHGAVIEEVRARRDDCIAPITLEALAKSRRVA